MHDLLRQHARALAAADDPADGQAAAMRLLDYYLHTAAAAGGHFATGLTADRPPTTDPPAWVPPLATLQQAAAWLEIERPNLHAAVDYAAARARFLHATQIPAAMSDFLVVHGHWDQCTVLGQTTLTAARQAGDRLGQADALTRLGAVHWLTGDYQAAAASLARGLALYIDLGGLRGQAYALHDLGVVQQLTGDYPAAAASHQEALKICRATGYQIGEAEALNNLGELLTRSSASKRAREHHTRALAIARDIRAPLEEARALEGIGRCHLQDGNCGEGDACLRQALMIYQHLGAPGAQRIQEILHERGL